MAKKSDRVTSRSVNRSGINSYEHTPVIFYTAKPCIWCDAARDFLKLEKINFKEIDVSNEGEARQEMIRKSKQERIPVMDIGGKIIIGYDPEEIRKAVNKDSRPKSFFHLFARRAKANNLEEAKKAFLKPEKKMLWEKRSAKPALAVKKEVFPSHKVSEKATEKIIEKTAHKPSKPIFFKKPLSSKERIIPVVVKKKEEKARTKKKSFHWLILLVLLLVFIILSLVYLFVYDKLDILGALFESLSSGFNLYLSKVGLFVESYLNTEIKFYTAFGILSLLAALIALSLFRSIYLNHRKKLGIMPLQIKKKPSFFSGLFKKKEEEIKPLPSAKIEISRNETEMDSLYHLIQKRGKVDLQEVMHNFGVSKELAEEWAQILESHELITINYPLFNPPILSLSLKAVESKAASKESFKAESVKEPALLKTEKTISKTEKVKEEAEEKTKGEAKSIQKPSIAPKTKFHRQMVFHRPMPASIRNKIKSKLPKWKARKPSITLKTRFHKQREFHRPFLAGIRNKIRNKPPKEKARETSITPKTRFHKQIVFHKSSQADIDDRIRIKPSVSSLMKRIHQKSLYHIRPGTSKAGIRRKISQSHTSISSHHLKDLHLKKKEKRR